LWTKYWWSRRFRYSNNKVQISIIMTSKIKVDNITNQSDSNIVNKCGTTITLGASGDTINLASGASQTGFGRTGTVDWDTTAKTTNFNAVSGNGYFVNTTSGSITATLPASPSAGDIVGFNDYARTFATNNLTVARNGSNIQGEAADGTFSTNGQSTMFVYVDGTQGWVPTEDQTTGNYGASYITATGGTVTCCGDYKIHTFTGPGTFTVCSVGNPSGSDSVDYLVVAGGGGAGGDAGGGGGAGGTRFSDGTASGCYTAGPSPLSASALPVSAQAYPITVGSGGSATPCGAAPGPSPSNAGNPGNQSIFLTITSAGGGGGGGHGTTPVNTGAAGGSGGGARSTGPGATGGAGNTPPVSPPQGNPGGSGVQPSPGGGGSGGGGAVCSGSPNVILPGPGFRDSGGPGGTGLTSSITASPVGYGGGGGGGSGGQPGAQGGTGTQGGGSGSNHPGTPGNGCGTAGSVNTGGGGGGGSDNVRGRNGGSGIVVIRYKYQ
jgi:hypothetical protein